MKINDTVVSLHYDYRGMPAEATNAAGAATSCGPFSPSSCIAVPWPAGNWKSTLESKQALETPDWYGSLAIAQRDDTGNLYRRTATSTRPPASSPSRTPSDWPAVSTSTATGTGIR